MKTKAIAGWFGSNRTLAPHVGRALEGCHWVGIPFAGSLSEVPHISARTILVSDKHRLVINLVRVIRCDKRRPDLIQRLQRKLFHPDELTHAQHVCRMLGDELGDDETSVVLAEHYFMCCWMGRASKAGTVHEFNGKLSTRWRSGGGDSPVRYWSALRGLAEWAIHLRRCYFSTDDAFDFLKRCEDWHSHGLYCDPPFPGAGRIYKHNAGQTDFDETNWHKELYDQLNRFERSKIICRFYDHPLIRKLYLGWDFTPLVGRKQTNGDAPELLVTRRVPANLLPSSLPYEASSLPQVS